MSAVRGYVMWRVKPGVEIKQKDLTYFSPGGYTFTHKSGEHICFDFEESSGSYKEEDGLFDWNHREIDNDLITSGLEYDNHRELIQEQYDINFFRDGKVDLVTPEGEDYPIDEMHCCMDLIVNGIEIPEVDDEDLIEPVYMAVFDPYNPDDVVELYNKLTPEEYKKYCESEVKTNG